MCEQSELEELRHQVERLQEAIDEIKAAHLGLEQHVVRATATLRVVVELVKDT
jgi:prefoldin subunit 5